MKAKEYYDQIVNETDKKKEILVIANAFLQEAKSIMEMRHAKSNQAVISILDEQNKKFIKFASLVNADDTFDFDIKYTGFKEYVRLELPKVYDEWIKSK